MTDQLSMWDRVFQAPVPSEIEIAKFGVMLSLHFCPDLLDTDLDTLINRAIVRMEDDYSLRIETLSLLMFPRAYDSGEKSEHQNLFKV